MLFAVCAMATEEPAYTVVESDGEFELRYYEPLIVAETLVSGSMGDASGSGFRVLADYIFGNNTVRDGGSGKVSMTAPVTMAAQSEEISMTAPVSMERSAGQWRMHFVMPSNYTIDTLPRPNNPMVTLREIPATHYAVIRFSGLAGEKKVAAKTTQLRDWLQQRGIGSAGSPELARYNPPWTLPFLRRNEVMIPYHPG
jgi:hypothetical protein